LDAIVESLLLNIAELLRRRIPAAAIVVWVVLTISLLRAVLGRAVLVHGHGASSHAFLEVRKCRIVAVAEAFAVFVTGGLGDRGMAESICSFDIWGTVILKVGPAGLDAIVESLPLNIAELLRRRIPAAAIVVWVVLTISLLRAVLGRAVVGNEQGGRSQGENKRWKSESNELH
jgi:hypothetical protein